MGAVPIHVRPTAALAPRALLPGDPGRALMLAQALLDEPRMFNHNRGLWGYTGTAADGLALTIQSTGIGGPSAAIVVSELIDLGLERAIRVGTTGALDPRLGFGDVLIAETALSQDGTSRALGAATRTTADLDLHGALRRAAPDATVGTVVSTDLFYDDGDRAEAWRRDGAIAVEMEAAALFALAAARGIAVACVLAVTDLLHGGERRRIDELQLQQAGERIGRIGAAALAADAGRSG